MDVEIERKKIVYNYRIDLIKVIALFNIIVMLMLIQMTN